MHKEKLIVKFEIQYDGKPLSFPRAQRNRFLVT
jgi:hypothetical protein